MRRIPQRPLRGNGNEVRAEIGRGAVRLSVLARQLLQEKFAPLF